MSTFLVVGVARSGTSFLYQRLGEAMSASSVDQKPHFIYEPYLWSIRDWNTKGHSFSNDHLSIDGLAMHKRTPLFVSNGSPGSEHCDWVRAALANDEGGPALGKVVRGAGRIGDYLAADPNLRVILVLRNPLDSANSLHAQFSVFGDEFFPSDWPRLQQTPEYQALGLSPNEVSGRMGRTLAWWRTMVAAAMEHANHERVLVVPYEAIKVEPETQSDALSEFLRPYANVGVDLESSRAAGPVTSTRSLRRQEIGEAKAALSEYQRYLGELGYQSIAQELPAELNRRFSKLWWKPGVFSYELGRDVNPLQVRLQASDACVEQTSGDSGALVLEDLVDEQIQSLRLNPFNARRVVPGVLEGERLFSTAGCVVTAHNDEGTLAAAVNSVLDQTLPYDHVVIVDDASSDGSLEIAEHYAANYSSVEVLPLTANVGPSAARHFGIEALGTEFFSHLDADDVLWPTKNFEEMLALKGDHTTIAFSDILLCREDESILLDASPYEGLEPSERNLALLSRVPAIPRDMTMHRSLYRDLGGYDFMLSMFEDFDFKLRASAQEYITWVRSSAPVGTLYNRSTAGLSQRDNLVQVQNVLHVLARNRDISKLSEDDFNNAVISAIAPFDCEFLTFFQMLIRYVGWSHYERLGRVDLLSFEGDELVVELAERLTDVRRPADAESLSQLDFRPSGGFARPVSLTTEAGRTEIREFVSSRAKVVVEIPEGCTSLVLKVRKNSGIDTKLLNMGDHWQATTHEHSCIEDALLYPYAVGVGPGETTIDIVGRCFDSPDFGPLNSKNAFLEGIYGVISR